MLNRLFKQTDILLNVVLEVMLILLIGAWCVAAWRNYISLDSGYYIGVTEQIYYGAIPYKDVALSYTPLAFYMLQIPRLFMGQSIYMPIMVMSVYFMLLMSAFFTALIVYRLTNNKSISLLTMLLFMLYAYNLQGIYIMLEGFVTFWGCMGLYLAINQEPKIWSLITSGICTAFAFMCKQYGLVFLPVVCLVIFFNGKDIQHKIQNLFMTLVAFVLALTIISVCLWIKGVDMSYMFRQLFLNGYGQRQMFILHSCLLQFIERFPYMIPVLIYCLVRHKTIDISVVVACVVGLCLSMLQFVFKGFLHYYIILLPFMLVLVALVVNDIYRWLPFCWRNIVLIPLTFCFIYMPVKGVSRQTKLLIDTNYMKSELSDIENAISSMGINRNKATLCFEGTIPFYIDNRMVPPLLKKYGYSFGYDSTEKMLERLSNSDFFVSYKSDYMDMQSIYHDSYMLLNDSCIFRKNELPNDLLVFKRITTEEYTTN